MFAATAGGGAMGMIFREKPANKNEKNTARKLAPARSARRKSTTRAA